jgi:hypothetical protein
MTIDNYWALAPSSEIANEINAKWSDHQKWLSDTRYGYMVQVMWDLYYGSNEGGFEVDISTDASTAKINVNHFKSLIQRLHSITTQAKLQYQPRARNSDAEAQIQSDFAKGLLEYYADEKNMTSVTSQMVETGLVMLDSYVYAPWDQHQGEAIAAGEGMQELKNGDQAFHLLSRFDVATHQTLDKTPWYIVRIKTHKYDLAALYPDKADEIIAQSLDQTNLDYSDLTTPFNSPSTQSSDDTVYVYHLLHDRTPSLSKGRYTQICGNVVLQDTVLPYKTLPVVHFQASQMIKTNGGDSPATMLVGVQQAINNIYSSNLSNNLHFNKQNVWSPTAIEIEKLSEGFNAIISPQMPQALQLTSSSPESYKLLQGLEGVAQTLSGVNSTTRGNPESSLKSGNSLALMLSISVMSADSIQKSYTRAAADLATIVVHNLQQFASEPRVAYIGGVSKKSYAKTFKNTDINSIDRISVDLGNPLIANYGGRYELLQQMMQFGSLQDPKKIIEFLRTGQIDSITEDDFKDTLLIRGENELIRKGQMPPVMVTDLHPDHINEHKQLASDPDVRNNPTIMANLTQHMMEHIQSYKTIDPDLAAILGLQPLPSQSQPPQGPPPGPQDGPPEMMDTNLPQPPPGTPPMANEAFDQATANLPPMNNEQGIV